MSKCKKNSVNDIWDKTRESIKVPVKDAALDQLRMKRAECKAIAQENAPNMIFQVISLLLAFVAFIFSYFSLMLEAGDILWVRLMLIIVVLVVGVSNLVMVIWTIDEHGKRVQAMIEECAVEACMEDLLAGPDQIEEKDEHEEG